MTSISIPQLFLAGQHMASSLMKNMNTHYPNVSMGNTEESLRNDMATSNELLINAVNENIKAMCLCPEYKYKGHCQKLIKQILNLAVNARDTQLEISLNSLSVVGIKRLRADAI